MAITTEANREQLTELINHLNHSIGVATYEGDRGRAYLECLDCKVVIFQVDGPQGVFGGHLASASADLLDRREESRPKGTLFDLDSRELDLFMKIEELFQEPMDENIDPGEESKRLVDEHLEQLGQVQEQLSAKLIGYVEGIKVLMAKAEMLKAEARLYEAEMRRLEGRAADNVGAAEFLQGRLKAFLERRGLTELEVGTYKLKIVNQGGKLPLLIASGITPEQVSPEFRREIPASVDFDRDAIHAALRAGHQLVIGSPVEDAGGAIETDGSGPFRAEVQWARHGARPTMLKIT